MKIERPRVRITATQWTRRHFLACAAAISASPLLLAAKQRVSLPAAFDKRVEEFMKEHGTPGGALAVVKDRRLIYARGYGWADRDQKLAATPESLFRICSVSKPLTAVAVLKLAEQKKLNLDSSVFEMLSLGAQLPVSLDAHVPKGTKLDARWRQITVRQLLQHTGGWDREKTKDPMLIVPEYFAKRFPDLPFGSPWAVIRFQLAKSLNFDPGTRYAYSNFGYCLLGRVIEKASGQRYETYVQQSVLAPAGIKRMRLGRRVERADGEVQYYDKNNQGATTEMNFEAWDSCGGWIGSVVDLARFSAALDNPRRSPLLKPASFTTMYAPPPPPVLRKDDGSLMDDYYGCGWGVTPINKKSQANYYHEGGTAGSNTLLVRLANGLSWAVLFNSRSGNDHDWDINPALRRAAESVTDWPTKDLFSHYS